MSLTMFNTKSLFPTPLENLRFFTQLCDLPIKENKKELDDIVYNKTIHPNKLNRIVNEIWHDNVKEVFPDEIVKTTSDAIIHHFRSYLDLVGEVPVDGLDRKKLQLILILFYFSAVTHQFLIQCVPEKYFFPNIESLIDHKKNSVKTILIHLKENNHLWQEYIKTLDRDGKNKLGRWERGEYLFSYQELKSLGDKSEEWKKIKFWLFIARIFDAIRKEELSDLFFFSLQKFHQLYQNKGANTASSISYYSLLSAIVKIQQVTNQKLAQQVATDYGQLRFEHLSLDKLKTSEAKDLAWRELTVLRAIVKNYGELENQKYHWDWLQARWLLLSGNLEKAVEMYKQAVDNALFRAGKTLKPIVQEAIVASAFLEKKDKLSQRKLLSHLKNAAILFNYELPSINSDTEKINHKEMIADWEVDMWARAFGQVFPRQGWFNGTDYPLLKPRSISLSTFDYESIKPDYKNPNRIVSIADGTKRMPQLVYFCWIWGLADSKEKENDIFKIIKKLLDNNADVNALSSENESALLFALETLNVLALPCVKQNRTLFDLLIQYSHTPKTINSQTSKKQKYPLRLAVETGRADVVQKILEMGAKPDMVNFEKLTPLYFCMSMFDQLTNPQKIKTLIEESYPLDKQQAQLQQEYFRRNSEKAFYSWQKSTDNLKFEENIKNVSIEVTQEQLEKHSSEEELLKIVQLLLDAGADPNYKHDVQYIRGYTPLMLAIELNNNLIFEAMKKVGGDTSITFDYYDGKKWCKESCADIKSYYSSQDIEL